jgi:hypothetical protein
MADRKPLVSAFCSLIPGLGQVYNGEILRGVIFFFGTYFSVFLFITGTLGLFGFGWHYDAFIGFLILGIIAWIAAGYDAYLRANRINSGEITVKPTTIMIFILFFLMVFLAVIILIFIMGILFATVLMGWMASNSAMHRISPHNITVTVERYDSTIVISHKGGDTSGLLEYVIRINDVISPRTLNTTPGSMVQVNGSSGIDHVKVDAVWLQGSIATIYDGYI